MNDCTECFQKRTVEIYMDALHLMGQLHPETEDFDAKKDEIITKYDEAFRSIMECEEGGAK